MAKTKQIITTNDVQHVAQLANLPLDPAKISLYQKQLEDSLEYVRIVQTLDLDNVEETVQISGLTNVWREDVVDPSRTFTQEQALANAPSSLNGFFMVNGIMKE